MAQDSDAVRARLLALHNRVTCARSGGGAEAEELAALLLTRLRPAVRRRVAGAPFDVIDDAVTDAIVRYLRRPAIYDDSKSRLDRFLAVVAARLAIDAIRRETRRRKIEIPIESVGAELMRPQERFIADGASLVSRMARTPEERRFISARLAGERKVEPLARLLGCRGEDPDVQRRVVKRTIERLRMRAKRLLGGSGASRH